MPNWFFAVCAFAVIVIAAVAYSGGKQTGYKEGTHDTINFMVDKNLVDLEFVISNSDGVSYSKVLKNLSPDDLRNLLDTPGEETVSSAEESVVTMSISNEPVAAEVGVYEPPVLFIPQQGDE